MSHPRDDALRLRQQWLEEEHRRIEALAPLHDPLIASIVAYHQQQLDALRARLDGAEHDQERRPMTLPPSLTLSIEPTEGAIADASEEAGSGSEVLDREQRELRSELDAANAEIEATRLDAIWLQGERDDALREADDVRLLILSEIGAARDEAIGVQAQLDETLRMVVDGRDRAREEQERLVEELDALRQELAACRQELARVSQRVA